MRSSILTASYLWKDTWQRWFEQPGSILARVLVTIVMTALSMLLLVAIQLQIKKLEAEVEKFGLDNIVVLENIAPKNVPDNLHQHRFHGLQNWGDLTTVERLPAVAYGGGKRVNVIAYGERSLPSLKAYLSQGHTHFLLSNDYPEGALLDYELEGHYVRALTIRPDDKLAQVLPGSLLFVPLKAFRHLTARGFTRINYLQRHPNSPPLSQLVSAIEDTVKLDRSGQVEIRSALNINQKLAKMKEKQKNWRLGMAGSLGAALALIYGTLSVLEFRQSMYVSALLSSLGASKVMLGLRTVAENLLIANATAALLILGLSKIHNQLFASLKLKLETTPEFLQQAYWGPETTWIFAFLNLGVLLSCLPVFWALRKPVGQVLN